MTLQNIEEIEALLQVMRKYDVEEMNLYGCHVKLNPAEKELSAEELQALSEMDKYSDEEILLNAFVGLENPEEKEGK